MAEALVKTIKRDYVWFGDLSNAETVMGQLHQWFEDYNENAPHKALKMMSPREFLKINLAGYVVRFMRGNSKHTLGSHSIK